MGETCNPSSEQAAFDEAKFAKFERWQHLRLIWWFPEIKQTIEKQKTKIQIPELKFSRRNKSSQGSGFKALALGWP